MTSSFTQRASKKIVMQQQQSEKPAWRRAVDYFREDFLNVLAPLDDYDRLMAMETFVSELDNMISDHHSRYNEQAETDDGILNTRWQVVGEDTDLDDDSDLEDDDWGSDYEDDWDYDDDDDEDDDEDDD